MGRRRGIGMGIRSIHPRIAKSVKKLRRLKKMRVRNNRLF